jgi:hypothetical protein
LSSALLEAGIKGTVKMATVPMLKNKFMLRLENIVDYFDDGADTYKVNKTMVIEALFKSANQANVNTNEKCISIASTTTDAWCN